MSTPVTFTTTIRASLGQVNFGFPADGTMVSVTVDGSGAAYTAQPGNVVLGTPTINGQTVVLTYTRAPPTNERAPNDSTFVVQTADPQLSAGRVITNTATINWDFATAGQAKAAATYSGLGTASVRADTDFPRTDVAQSLSSAQKLQARTNAGVAAMTVTKYLTGSGTYTTPAGCTRIRARLIGAGGGGAGSGSASAGNGGTGGSTTFDTLTAGGGAAGGGIYAGQGGTASGGNVANPAGSGGVNGTYFVTGGAALLSGGAGGSSAFAGAARSSFGAAGEAGATNTGGGGGGAGSTAGATIGSAGGGGSGGYCEHINSSPAASYSYAVGAAGTAGAAGTSGFAGGAGGSGIIIIEEYYGT